METVCYQNFCQQIFYLQSKFLVAVAQLVLYLLNKYSAACLLIQQNRNFHFILLPLLRAAALEKSGKVMENN